MERLVRDKYDGTIVPMLSLPEVVVHPQVRHIGVIAEGLVATDPLPDGGAAMTAVLQRPLPKPDAVSQGFWDAANRGAALPSSAAARCRTFQHPPRPVCRACDGTALAFERGQRQGAAEQLDGDASQCPGRLRVPRFPYSVLVVELIEQEGSLSLVGPGGP